MTGFRPFWLPEPWTQLSLPRLFDDDDEVGGVGRWSFAIVKIAQGGRVTLPKAARAVIEGWVSLCLSSRNDVVLLRDGGVGRRVKIDERSRFVVPCWLREAADPEGTLLVGTGVERDGRPVVLLAPPRLLCGFADAMVGDR